MIINIEMSDGTQRQMRVVNTGKNHQTLIDNYAASLREDEPTVVSWSIES